MSALDGSEIKLTSDEKAPLQVSDAIERLLANPELLSTVASAIGASAPTAKESEKSDSSAKDEIDNNSENKASSDTQKDSEDSSAKLPEIMASVAPAIAALYGKGGNQPTDDRTRLLCALKPYLNPRRKDAIDTIVKLAGISEILKNVK